MRPSHAANDGKLFMWRFPPSETGNPGDDINCRCWAEPVDLTPTAYELGLLTVGVGLIVRARPLGRVIGSQIIRRVGENVVRRVGIGSDRIFRRPEGVPKNWIEVPSKSGGVKYVDPKNAGNYVRIERGDPKSSQPRQKYDYVRWQKNGQALDRNGKPVVKESKESHIPVEDYKFKVELFK